MRFILSAALAATLFPSAAFAADCGQLKIVDAARMEPGFGGLREYVPVTINGTPKRFVLDTGGSLTQVARATAEELKLPVRQGDVEMYDVKGKISRDQASIAELIIAHMRGRNVSLPVNPGQLDADGLISLDVLKSSDLDLDFGSNTLKQFSPDHCSGQVVYWTSPANVAVIPFTMGGFHVTVPVTLDGKATRALIDTGAPTSTIAIPEAQRLFGLTPGSPDTPEQGAWDSDPSLKTYSHEFNTLAFGDVSVSNPKLTLIPNAMGRNADRSEYVGDRTKSDHTELNVDDMLIGMDVLRKLHIYFAFGEGKMYISSANAASATPATAPTN